MIDRYGVLKGKVRLSEMFFRPDMLDDEMMKNLLRGLGKTIIKERDGTIIDEVRNLLVTSPD